MGNDTSTLPAFQNLPPLSFALKDPVLILQNIISNYEAFYQLRTGQAITLAEADPRRLMIENFAYVIAQQRQIFDFGCKQNLLPFSSYPYLDAKGTQWGPTKGPRQRPSSALCTIQFTLAIAASIDTLVQQGTQVAAGNGIVFATTQDATIPAGSSNLNVSAACTVAGAIGNGYLPGQINTLINWNTPQVLIAVNIDTSTGGADGETDDQFRYRQYLIPDSYGSAGAIGQYLEAVYGVSPAILDVAVIGPQVRAIPSPTYAGGPPFPLGCVSMYVLETGPSMPNAATLAQVEAAVSAAWTRPTTDLDFALSPSGISYTVSVTCGLDVDQIPQQVTIEQNITNAVGTYNVWQQSKIGRALNPSYLSQLCMEAGAARCTVTSPVFTSLQPYQVPVLSSGSGSVSIAFVVPESDLVY